MNHRLRWHLECWPTGKQAWPLGLNFILDLETSDASIDLALLFFYVEFVVSW